MSRKHKGADTILYIPTVGTLVTSGALDDDSWYRINDRATSGSALPDLDDESMFKTPQNNADAITLVDGDEVWPLTLVEQCKVDVEITSEMGTVETTDSCDFPYVSNLPDGFSNISGSINTFQRFDDNTDEMVDVSKDLFNKVFDLVEDDGEGTYTATSRDDSDLLMMMLLNKDAASETGKVENWLLTPIILNSVSMGVPLKDALKGDFSFVKGQGPAQLYFREVPAT